jgi:hypothetical protein
VSRLARAVSKGDVPGETVLVLGGKHGAVALHVFREVPSVMVLHSPEETREPWTGPCPCRYLEGACWQLGGDVGASLAESLSLLGAMGREDDERTWKLMGDAYRYYLERGRR